MKKVVVKQQWGTHLLLGGQHSDGRWRGYAGTDLRLAQGQARQSKSKKENKYVIKVMNSNREGGRGAKDAQSLFIGQ